jgi:ATP-dependent exoDNAse (exonuclease V) alpha subunit
MSTLNIEDIILSEDQQKALDDICDFIHDPKHHVFVLAGFAGTGKSTLVRKILDHLPKFLKTVQLVNPNYDPMPVKLTATTNKACEALSHITGEPVVTIHSHLGLRLNTDWKTGENTLVADKAKTAYSQIIFIDEASFIDKKLLRHIFDFTENCKIIFMGDPAQLAPVKSNETPVFKLKYPGAKLTEVMRQAADNPIIRLATLFRVAVETETMVNPDDLDMIDDEHIKVVDRDTFNEMVKAEFTRPDWKFADSKVLAWTNRRVIEYNHFVREFVKGDPDFEIGDMAVVNQFCQVGKTNFKTDQMVTITDIVESEVYGCPGKTFTLDDKVEMFMPLSLEHRRAASKRASDSENYSMVVTISQSWVDLRAAYACTINKSQGSTYGKVFIDLDDIGMCRQKDQVNRMLYVGFSRPRHELVITGDLR